MYQKSTPDFKKLNLFIKRLHIKMCLFYSTIQCRSLPQNDSLGTSSTLFFPHKVKSFFQKIFKLF